jgi:hypothetical protein
MGQDIDRRRFVKGAAGAGVAVWATPQLLSVQPAFGAVGSEQPGGGCDGYVGGVVLSADFENGAPPEFSSSLRNSYAGADGSTTTILGQFSGNESVTLTVSGLSACHTRLAIAFDLWVMDSWDGNAEGRSDVGPDVWSVATPDGQVHHYTFASPSFAGMFTQTYPDEVGGGNHSPGTGGTNGDYGSNGSYADSRYSLGYTSSHTGSTASWTFSTSTLQGVGDEGWGLDNVVVTALP